MRLGEIPIQILHPEKVTAFQKLADTRSQGEADVVQPNVHAVMSSASGIVMAIQMPRMACAIAGVKMLRYRRKDHARKAPPH